MQFIGNDSVVANTRLIIPSLSLGWIPTATLDALIHTFNFQKIGQFEDSSIPEVVCAFSSKVGISTALELFYSNEYKLSIIQMRSHPIPGFSADFALKLFDWIKTKRFAEVFILTSANVSSRNRQQTESAFVGGKRFLYSPSFPKNLIDLLSEKHWTELEQWKEKNSIPGGTGNLWVLLGAAFGLSRQQLVDIRKARDEPSSSLYTSSASSSSSSVSSSFSVPSSSSLSSGGTAILTVAATSAGDGNSLPNIFTFLTIIPAPNIIPVCALFFFGSDSPHHTANSARYFAEEICELFGLVRKPKQVSAGEGSRSGSGGTTDGAGVGAGVGAGTNSTPAGEKKKKKKTKKQGELVDEWEGLGEWGPRKIWNTQHELY